MMVNLLVWVVFSKGIWLHELPWTGKDCSWSWLFLGGFRSSLVAVLCKGEGGPMRCLTSLRPGRIHHDALSVASWQAQQRSYLHDSCHRSPFNSSASKRHHRTMKNCSSASMLVSFGFSLCKQLKTSCSQPLAGRMHAP